MPIYEYQCQLCGHQFEAIQAFSDAPLRNCPECHKDGLQKLVSASAFHLKGTGWYVTDIRDKDKPKTPSKEETSTTDANTKEKTTEPEKSSSKDSKDKSSKENSGHSSSSDSSAAAS